MSVHSFQCNLIKSRVVAKLIPKGSWFWIRGFLLSVKSYTWQGEKKSTLGYSIATVLKKGNLHCKQKNMFSKLKCFLTFAFISWIFPFQGSSWRPSLTSWRRRCRRAWAASTPTCFSAGSCGRSRGCLGTSETSQCTSPARQLARDNTWTYSRNSYMDLSNI